MSRKLTPPFRLILKRQDRVDYVFAGVCNYFKITPQELKKLHYNKNALPKRFAIKVLRDIADISLKEIGFIFSITESAVYQNYQNISVDLDHKTYGNTEMKNKYRELLGRLEY